MGELVLAEELGEVLHRVCAEGGDVVVWAGRRGGMGVVVVIVAGWGAGIDLLGAEGLDSGCYVGENLGAEFHSYEIGLGGGGRRLAGVSDRVLLLGMGWT